MTADGERVDVLIVTAIKLEYDELLKVTTALGAGWVERPGPTGFKIAFCDFAVPSGGTLRIAATPALDMGGVATAAAAAPLVHTYQPRCLAMSGVCAGRRGDVRLGDVIIADKLWTYDTGATVVETDDDGRTHERFKADPATYNLHAKWLETARTFRPSVSEPWLADRPRSYDDQGDWLMARLLAGENPREHQDRPSRCADFAAVVKRLRERKWLARTGLTLTKAGRVHIDDRVMLHPDGLPERESFTVHVGPIGTGTRVVRDAQIFDKLSVHMRKVLGLEMVAAAIGAIAHQHDVERMIVMKGVMDYADPDKNDNFKHFAARASAECLIAFLRQNLPPRAQLNPVPLLGTSELPPKAGTAALLNARAVREIVGTFAHATAPPSHVARREWLPKTGPLKLVLSYAIDDGVEVEKLRTHLASARRRGVFEVWDQSMAGPVDRRAAVAAKLAAAHVIVPLFSPAYLASPCFDEELDVARKRHEAGSVLVIPVLLKPSDVDVDGEGRLWFEGLVWVPSPLNPGKENRRYQRCKPITIWEDRDEALSRAVAELKQLVDRARGEAAPIGALAHQHDVADHAEPDEKDSAKHVAVRPLPHDHILISGTSEPPLKAGTAALLNARHQIVRFFGRTDLLADLAAWCESDAPARTRLIHATGGMGKTRLLIQLCQDMHERSFRAGFVPTRLDPARFAELVHSDQPTLAVIDYANSRTDLHALLAPVLRLRNQGGAARVRVVLLARGKGDWWEAALRSDIGDLLRDEEPLELLPLAVKGEERERMFRAAVAYFAEHRKKQPVSAPAPPLDDPRFDRALFVHMAALATVDGYSFSADTLMSDTLDHEERFWSHAFAVKSDREERQKVRVVRRAVTAITLRGGASDEPEAESLIERISGARDPDLVMLLRDLYPGGAAYLARLEPDLLGEAMVHRTLSEEGKSAAALLDRAFDGADEHAIRSGFEVLGRISGDHIEAEAWIARVLDGDVVARAVPAFMAALVIAVEDPIKERAAHTRLGMTLAKALEAKGTVEIASRLEPDLPKETVALREVALWVTETRLKHLPGGTEPKQRAERARLLHNLSTAQGDLGRLDDALASAEEAAAIRRELAETHSVVFLPDLADSLNNLGARQSDMGRREAALASAEEAVAIYSKLAEAFPEAFMPDLARSLQNVGCAQSELDRRESALASTQAAVAVYRKLARPSPEAFLADLAVGLNNLCGMQSKLGRHDDAIASAEEALAIHRELAHTHPEAFPPRVAINLFNLANRQSELGRHGEALASAEEVVAICRRLAAGRPGAFLPFLARSLGNLGTKQGKLGRLEDALVSTNESVAIYRKLVETHPEAFLPYLAVSLNDLGFRLSTVGRCDDAITASREAVVAYSKLVQACPEAFLPNLAASLLLLGALHSQQGRLEDALASTEEAVASYRELAATRPEAFLPDLAESLNNLGHMQGELGRHEAALASSKEAVATHRELARTRPEALLPNLARSLNNLAIRQNAVGQQEAALVSAEEAVAIRRKLAEARPEAFLPDLAESLNNLGLAQSVLGRRDDALAFIEEAVAIHRKLAEARPEAFLPGLAGSLNNLGSQQSELGLHEEALASTEEALAMRRKLVEKRPEAFLPDLATNLYNLGVRQSALGRHEAALASTEEAVAIRRKLVEGRPEAFLPDLAAGLNNLGLWQNALGRREDALASTEEALEAIWPFFLVLPAALGRSTGIILGNLLRLVLELGREPSPEMLERLQLFQRTQAG